MASTWVMILMCVGYFVIAVLAAVERNGWRVLYYVGAILITISVMGMTWKTRG